MVSYLSSVVGMLLFSLLIFLLQGHGRLELIMVVLSFSLTPVLLQMARVGLLAGAFLGHLEELSQPRFKFQTCMSTK